MWLVAGALGLLAVLTGWLPGGAAREVAVTRAGPVLAFLVGITVLAELADAAGVFDAAAGVCARAGGGSTRRLFLLVAALGTLTTIGMSLDTTAVLLTPVVLTLAARLGLRPLPFAFLVVWLAGTASLLLPVSNLTNLLAVQHLGASTGTLAFAGRMALPEVVAVVVTVAYLGLWFRRDLTGGYDTPAPTVPADRLLFRVCAAACLALVPGVLLGAPPWTVAVPAAAVCGLAFAVRRRRELRPGLVPWRLLVLTEGLFLAVTALDRHGLGDLLAHAAGTGTLRTAGVGAVSSNVVNNLPAYLAVEPAVAPGHTTQLLGLLLGTDAGPLITLWGSLATLLWRQRCTARGVRISPWLFARVGLLGVPLVLVASWAALRVTG